MRRAGQVVLFRFPNTDLVAGKLRPALLLGRLPGEGDDWLMCMISSQLRHYVAQFDEVVQSNAPDFADSGLRITSVIRVGRLAAVDGAILAGATGQIAQDRLLRIRNRLSEWLKHC